MYISREHIVLCVDCACCNKAEECGRQILIRSSGTGTSCAHVIWTNSCDVDRRLSAESNSNTDNDYQLNNRLFNHLNILFIRKIQQQTLKRRLMQRADFPLMASNKM